MLRARLLSALVLVPVIFLLIYQGGLFWLAAVLIAGVLGWREMVMLLEASQFTLDRTLGFFFVVGAIVEAYLRATELAPFELLRPLLTGLIIFSLIWALYYRGEHPTANWGATVASALYLGFMLGHFVTLREQPNGFWWLLLALSLAWIYDSMAYFVGSAIGKHQLWPRISPKKSWEGLVGGSIACILAGPLLGAWWHIMVPWQGLLIGFLIALFVPFGDFAVSLFKRMAQIKDSGGLIPGHGGILDRLDSLLFIIPVATYFVQAVVQR